MKHTIYNKDLFTELIIDETLCENTAITICGEDEKITTHYLTPKDLKNFIGALLHVQAKKRKEAQEFDNLSNKF